MSQVPTGSQLTLQRILVVEDERAMSDLLEQALRESGFSVAVAQTGRQGLAMAKEYDLLIVDVMMPELNGFDMVRQVREQGHRMPALFLTARDAVRDRVKGLDLGGDDYLVKPFKLEELLARIRALLRRTVEQQDVLSVADLSMDRRSRKLKRGDRQVFLSNTEFSLLELLMMHPGETVSKQTILREVWDTAEYRDENVVEVYINYIRAKLESGGMPRLIHTVRNKGYILEAREKKS